MYYLPWWMQWAQAIALILISCLGSWIAFKQVRIAAAKLNLDLFDRRFRVFEAARTMLGQFLQNGAVTLAELDQFSIGVADAIFLFDDEVEKYLADLRKQIISHHFRRTRLSEMDATDPARNEVIDRLAAIEEELVEEFPHVVALFKPYLKLGSI